MSSAQVDGNETREVRHRARTNIQTNKRQSDDNVIAVCHHAYAGNTNTDLQIKSNVNQESTGK